HPYRMLAHNGEVNTLEGNRNWMRARHSQLESELLGGDISDLLPIIRAGGSDSATLDNVVELLVMAGRSLPHALMMLIPEAFAGLDRGKVFADGEIEAEIAARRPYGAWFEDHVVNLDDLPEEPTRPRRYDPLRVRQLAFGWTAEDVRVLVTPLATKAKEADGSMGSDVPLAVLSDRSPSLFSYFKQRFAQVTNPAIDPIRESIVMSLQAAVGPELNLLEESPNHAHQLVMPQPVLRNDELHQLRNVDHYVFDTATPDCTWPLADGPGGLGQ